MTAISYNILFKKMYCNLQERKKPFTFSLSLVSSAIYMGILIWLLLLLRKAATRQQILPIWSATTSQHILLSASEVVLSWKEVQTMLSPLLIF